MPEQKIRVRLEATLDGRLRACSTDGLLRAEANDIGELRRRIELEVLAIYGEGTPVTLLIGEPP